MDNQKNEILLEKVDSTIEATCEWIMKGLEDEQSGLYPTDVIEALAKLLSTRALLEDTFRESYFTLSEEKSSKE